jgi:hypothetical protein
VPGRTGTLYLERSQRGPPALGPFLWVTELSSASHIVQDAINLVDHSADFFVGPKFDATIKVRDRLPRPLPRILELEDHKAHVAEFGLGSRMCV